MNEKFKIFDNLLSQQDEDFIEDFFMNEKLPWIYHKSTVIGKKNQSQDFSWFSHKFITSNEVISEHG